MESLQANIMCEVPPFYQILSHRGTSLGENLVMLCCGIGGLTREVASLIPIHKFPASSRYCVSEL
jgi:hypothetical protein